VVGYATAVPGILPEDTWRGFFRLAKLSPKRVVVPDDAENVVGAVMLALGHSWSSSSASDLADARRFLLDLRHALVVAGDVNRFRLGNFLAAMSSGLGFRHPELGIRFVVPKDGAVISMRSYCIPALAPDPVTAHAWLNDTLAPQIVRQDVVFSERASPVVEANFVIPSEILINPAIYPPAEVSDGLQFSTVSDAGAAARSALWAEVRPS
jgi:spermidine/putrescine transport system substrate-binding protein